MQKFVGDKEKEFQRKIDEERRRIQVATEQTLRKSITGDFENKLRLLEEANKDNEEKLRSSRQKELEFLKREQDLKNKEAELELSAQRILQEERANLTEEIRRLENQKVVARETEYQMKLKELEKQLEDTKKLAAEMERHAEEMKRKAEQGSMQLQGEVQELALEAMLRSAFPFDTVNEVGKGVKGADCILTVRNEFGQECGRIIYESKRTANFSMDWIEKLKADKRSQGADIAVIVTQALPKDINSFGEKDGVYISSYGESRALTHVLRNALIELYKVSKTQENTGDKMHLLYGYLTSNEFGEQWKAIREGFLSMRQSIQRERDAMERLWKAREKQLEKVLINVAHVRGSIEGIAGKDTIKINLIEDGFDELSE
jgi:hypothetical protein